jgi:hypothetical protein
VPDRQLHTRSARVSAEAGDGWDSLAGAVRQGRPSFSALIEALGLYLHEHRGRLHQLTEADQREIVRHAHDIDFERRGRQPRS